MENKYGRIYNFAAGPSTLPLEVLEEAQRDLLNYKGSGMSVMEMSHRSPVYQQIIDEAEADLRKLMNIPDNYKVLFLQGGATTQFAAVPYNLLTGSGKADYAVTGNFSKNAMKEAEKYGDIKVVASSDDRKFAYIPVFGKEDIRPDADYVHICHNNTVFGTTYNYTPDTGDIPLVADMSSDILSGPVDVTEYGVIYAGAQKNMAPAGLTLVIVREDLLGKQRPDTPVMFNWETLASKGSMYNTPPCFCIYMAGLVYKWLLRTGGLEERLKINREKAAVLYDYLDSQDFYKPLADKEARSLMNVTFVTGDEELDKKFVSESKAAGMSNLKGHRVLGGMRASIYNAMTKDGVEYLVEFMKKFADENRKG